MRVATMGDQIDVEPPEVLAGPRCASVSGVNVHANVSVAARDRMGLERLCRYAGRPPVAIERLSLLPDGRLLYRLKRRWRNGTTHVIFEPLELIEKFPALGQFRVIREIRGRVSESSIRTPHSALRTPQSLQSFFDEVQSFVL